MKSGLVSITFSQVIQTLLVQGPHLKITSIEKRQQKWKNRYFEFLRPSSNGGGGDLICTSITSNAPDTSCVSNNSDITYPGDSIRFHKWRAKSYKMAPPPTLPRPVASPSLSPMLLINWPKARGSKALLQLREPIQNPGRDLHF